MVRHLTLGDQTVQVLIVRTLNTEITTADIVDGLIVDHKGAVRVLKSGVSGQDRVVRLDNSVGDLGGGVDGEFQLALLAIVDRKALHEQSTEAGTGTTTKGVEDQEALKSRAVVGNAANLVEDLIDEFLADRVVATSIVVGGILLASDHLLGVEQAAVGAGADLVDDIWLEIAVDGAGDIFALARLGEEGREALIVVGLVLALFGQVAIWLDAVLEAVQLPARVRDLATCLAHCVAEKSAVARARQTHQNSRVTTYR